MDVTVKFKPGLMWSDGQPLTSADFAYTIKWAQDPNQVGLQVDPDAYATISGVDTPDATTAVVHFKQQYGPYLGLLGSAILPQHVWSKIPINADTAKNPEVKSPTVVSGPFKVQSADLSQQIVLVRNDNYKPVFGMNAYLDKIIFQATSTTQNAVDSLLKGDIDAVENLQETDLPKVQGKPNVTVSAIPGFTYEHLTLNTRNPILSDVAVRTALDEAIDRNAIIKQLLTPQNSTLPTSVNPLSFVFDSSLQATAYNADDAKKVLDAAGWAAGSDGIRAKGGTRLSLTISTTSGNKRREDTEQILIAYWKAVGIEVKAQNYSSDQFFGDYSEGGILARGKFDIGMFAWQGGPDPDGDYSIFASDSIPTDANKGQGQNYTGYADSVIDQALKAQRATVDFSQRAAAWQTFQQEFVKIKTVLPLYTRIQAAAYNQKLANYKNNPTSATNEWNVVEWYLKS
jgi:peptide/nickel transport system substrate-binding protein